MRKLIGGFSLVLVMFTYSYSQSGQLDPSFGSGGKLIITEVNNNQIADRFYNMNGRMAIQPDGKIILTAITRSKSIDQSYDMLILRLHPDGKPDLSFGENGAVVIDYKPKPDIRGYSNNAKDVAVTLQGKIVVIGHSVWFNDAEFESEIIIVQLNADGSRDVSFDGDGIKRFSFGSEVEYAEAVAVRPNGNIVVACHILNAFEGKRDIMLFQLKPDGERDIFFGLGGITGISLGGSETVSTLFIQPDGKLIVGGSIQYTESGESDYVVARFLAGGNQDYSFSDDAIVTFDMNGNREEVTGIAVQSDGKIVVTGGHFPIAGDEYGIAVARINENGILDSGFDGDGKLLLQLPGLPESKSILVDAQDHILVAGNMLRLESASYDFVVIKLTPDGKRDLRFGSEGIAYVDFFRTEDILGEMEFQPDGKIVLAGRNTPLSGPRYALARMFHVSEPGPSNVKATYIGPTLLGTPCYGCQTAIIPLRASIQDLSPYRGDIRNARVKFVDRDNAVDITGWIPVTKLISNDKKRATVDATMYVTLSYDQPVKRIKVGMVVDNGNYIRNDVSDDATITLYMPQEDMISGGGQLFASGTSMGKYKSDAGSRTLFGFFAQMKPGMSQPSGRMDMWFSGTNESGNNKVYHLEVSSIRGLGVDATSFTSGREGEFHGSGQLWDKTGTTPLLIEDNVTVQTHLIDRGEPGAYDFLRIYIWDSNNVLLHSSNWAYTQATPELLFEGNVTVHSGSSLNEPSPEWMTKGLTSNEKENVNRKELTVTVLNNPTNKDFGLKVSSSISNVYSVRIMDVSGRVIETRTNLPMGKVCRIGTDYKKGMYFAEVRQGKIVRIIKLVKY